MSITPNDHSPVINVSQCVNGCTLHIKEKLLVLATDLQNQALAMRFVPQTS